MSTCVAGRFHAPRPRTTEEHHVIPQAWQRFWHPAGAEFVVIHPQDDPHNLTALFDARTVTLCPTHHRNVHFWIVTLMKASSFDVGALTGREDPAQYQRSVFGKRRLNVEQATALLALQHWKEAGGSLVDLQGASLYGEA